MFSWNMFLGVFQCDVIHAKLPSNVQGEGIEKCRNFAERYHNFTNVPHATSSEYSMVTQVFIIHYYPGIVTFIYLIISHINIRFHLNNN